MTHADYDWYQPLIPDIRTLPVFGAIHNVDLIEKLRVTVIWKSMPGAFFRNRDQKNHPWI